MSLVITARPNRPVDSLPLAVLIGWSLVTLMTLGKAVAVWRTGVFFGPDDAMRAVEVRDFMNGQGWFDLVPRRLSPGHPFTMHWSRLADLPLAGLEWTFGRWTDAATAERLTRIVEPAAFYAATLVCLATLARDLCGPRGPLAVGLLAAGALDTVGDFMPGRIHHHALQILLLVGMVKFACDGLDPRRSDRMAVAGLLAALSLGINLQNMPFLAALAAVLGVLWAAGEPALRRGVGRFGLGLATGAATVFLAEVPPGRYGEGACDAFGTPHLLGAVAAGLAFVALSALAGRCTGRRGRFSALALAGGLVIGLLHTTYPACLGDPYGGVDPFVRTGWMAQVGEALPLMRLFERDPAQALPIMLALLLGLATTGVALKSARGESRSRWILLLVLSAVACLGSLWQVRVAATAEILGTLGGAWLLCRLFADQPAGRRYVALRAVATGLALTTAGWTAVAAYGPRTARSEVLFATGLDRVDPGRCDEPASYEGLAALRPGLVLSTIDPGAQILAHTAHSAIAAPYHRDGYGLRLALTVFGASPEDAHRLVVESKADYVALCTASPEVHDFVRDNPQGFAARLLGAAPPVWITPLDGAGPWRLYAIERSR